MLTRCACIAGHVCVVCVSVSVCVCMCVCVSLCVSVCVLTWSAKNSKRCTPVCKCTSAAGRLRCLVPTRFGNPTPMPMFHLLLRALTLRDILCVCVCVCVCVCHRRSTQSSPVGCSTCDGVSCPARKAGQSLCSAPGTRAGKRSPYAHSSLC